MTETARWYHPEAVGKRPASEQIEDAPNEEIHSGEIASRAEVPALPQGEGVAEPEKGIETRLCETVLRQLGDTERYRLLGEAAREREKRSVEFRGGLERAVLRLAYEMVGLLRGILFLVLRQAFRLHRHLEKGIDI